MIKHIICKLCGKVILTDRKTHLKTVHELEVSAKSQIRKRFREPFADETLEIIYLPSPKVNYV